MPTGFQRHTSGPMRTAGTFVAPCDDLANAALRANAAGTNPDPFTAEHQAAYYAFASVTDRKDALTLHRGNVTWDDVNAYGEAGLGFTNYGLMVHLMAAGVTPAVVRTWKAVHHNLPYSAMTAFTKAGLTTGQAAPYFLREGNLPPAVAPVDLETIPALIAAGISAQRAHHYRACGITRTKGMLELHRSGCRPAVLYSMMKNSTHHKTHNGLIIDSFPSVYRKARRTGATADFCNAMFAMGATLALIDTWHATGAPADVVGLLHGAGITAAEYIANPDIAADPDALAALAALRGHTVTVVSRGDAMLAA